ncbi:MAG: tetratricopeptide repeat protein [Bacteroidota bacterium]
MNKKTLTIAIAYFLVTISIVTYYPTLFNHIINWKDSDLFNAVSSVMKGHENLFSLEAYAPLGLAFVVFQRSFSEYGYFLFHAVSMILHAANSVLIFFIIRRLIKSDRVALLTAILFSVHPIQVETVSWLSTQGIVVSTFVLLLAFLCYLRFRLEGKTYFWRFSILLSVMFYLLAPPALYLVFILIGIDLLKDSKILFAHIKQKWLILFVWSAAFLFGAVRRGGWSYLSQLYYDSTAMIRLGIVEGVVRILYPFQHNLVVSADEIAKKSLLYGESVYPLIVIVLAALIIWDRKRYPVVFYGFVFFIVTSVPLLSGRSEGDWALSDHTYYLSSIGMFVIIGQLIDVGLSKLYKQSKALLGAYALCGCIVALLAYNARTATGYWKDNSTFWNEAHDENPVNTFVLTQRGMYYYSKFEIQKSLENLDKVVELAPEDEQSFVNRGLVHLDALDIESAVSDFTEASRLAPSDPTSYFDLGIALSKDGKFDSAKVAFSKAIDLNPSFSQAFNSRANAFAKTGNYVLAFADYHRALELNPVYAEAYANRAFTFLQTGNFQRALGDFRKQIELAPNRFDAKIHCGFTEFLAGDTLSASSYFSSALKIDSANGKMYLLGVSKIFLRSDEETQAGKRLFHQLGLE